MIYEQITIEKDLYLKLLAESKELEKLKNKDKCKFYDICPSCSGWCNNSEPSGKCVEFILSAYERLNKWIEIEKKSKCKAEECCNCAYYWQNTDTENECVGNYEREIAKMFINSFKNGNICGVSE